MSRIVFFVIFIAFFIVFAIIKFVFTGAKAAYDAVFNPNKLDDHARLFLARVMIKTELELKISYVSESKSLQSVITSLIPEIQELGKQFGYVINKDMAYHLILQATNHSSVYVPPQEIERASRYIE